MQFWMRNMSFSKGPKFVLKSIYPKFKCTVMRDIQLLNNQNKLPLENSI